MWTSLARILDIIPCDFLHSKSYKSIFDWRHKPLWGVCVCVHACVSACCLCVCERLKVQYVKALNSRMIGFNRLCPMIQAGYSKHWIERNLCWPTCYDTPATYLQNMYSYRIFRRLRCVFWEIFQLSTKLWLDYLILKAVEAFFSNFGCRNSLSHNDHINVRRRLYIYLFWWPIYI